MPKNQHMIRLDDEIYRKLVMKKAELINKWKTNYTLSETIELILLEATIYEGQQK